MSEHDIITLPELDPNITLPWIIDEFDASFNELAQATLRYHLYHDGTDTLGADLRAAHCRF